MSRYTVEDVKVKLLRCAELSKGIESQLTEIDSINGDGDLGVSMAKGMDAIEKTVNESRDAAIAPLLMKCGMAFNKAAPSTMGTLIGMALMSVGNAWKANTDLGEEELVVLPTLIAESIIKMGKAKPGDKTVLDALCPFAETLKAEFASSGDFDGAYAKAVETAKAGMEATKGMQAKVGRARWLGERAIQNYDGGAVLCAYIVENIR